MTPEEELKKSEQAKKILEDPIFIEANDKLKKELMDEIVNSPIRDTEAREKLYFMIKMHESVLNQLKSIMETGKLIKK
jgi:hypothetical protein|tara:strand:+ start:438 stop:671 length:234 start_codon:yes stop_codon:yes gene_type:complete